MALHPEPLLFAFEAEASQTLTFIPLSVRFNLDRCSLRISLDDWQTLPHARRAELARFPLAEEPSGGSFADALLAMLADHACPDPQRIAPVPDPDWRRPEVSLRIAHQCALAGLASPRRAAWNALSEFQRYALTKLSRKPVRNHDFEAAMQEFGLSAPLA